MNHQHDAPEGGAEQPVAYMVNCGNTDIAQGDVRFWRAKRKDEAHGCALAHGTIAVPLYLAPTPPAPSGLEDTRPLIHDAEWRNNFAKAAADRAAKNSGVAPELLFAPILWELEDQAAIPAAERMGASAPSAFWKNGKRTTENGCCSSLECCSWQRLNPNSLCSICRDATLSGQQGGAVPAGDLRPGLRKALEIVEAECETVSSSSGSYLRLGSVSFAIRAVLDGASGQEEGR